jgi:putative transposase
MGLKLRLVSGQIGRVLGRRAIGRRRTLGEGTAKAIRAALRPRPCPIARGLATDLLRTRAELVAENALLRQQLVVAARKVRRPLFRRHERAAVALLTAALPRWKDAQLLVQPETVFRCHREGFRLLWRRPSRPTKTPATRISPDVIDLVRRMAAANRLGGAERIRGELLKLGIRVAKRSVQRHLHEGHRPRPRGVASASA